MKNALTLLLLLATTMGLVAQSTKDVNIDYMLRGYFYAGTAQEDDDAPGGFASSDNSPKTLPSGFKTSKTGFFIYVDTLSNTSFAKEYRGYRAFIVNKSSSQVGLPASDGCINAIAEAWVDGKWQAIEYFPSSWCGNSYHTVFANPGQYWEFAVPRYTGKLLTKIRYRLQLNDNKVLYSNAFSASINRKQLSEKQGHSPGGLMDPYND